MARPIPPGDTSPKPEPSRPGFFATLKEELTQLLKHPARLIPTIVLAVVWTVLPLLMGFLPKVNLPIVRFIATLTYANGGIFGGFFGTLGGIFGKVIFAAAVNSLVLSIVARRNPFKGLWKSLGGIAKNGVSECLLFLIGGGVGFVLYFFFNITCAPQNVAVSVVCALTALQALARQNGLLFAAVFFLLRTISGGKAPTRGTVSRLLVGLTAGFGVAFPLTFLRYPFLILIIGAVFLVGGLTAYLILKNTRRTAADGKGASS